MGDLNLEAVLLTALINAVMMGGVGGAFTVWWKKQSNRPVYITQRTCDKRMEEGEKQFEDGRGQFRELDDRLKNVEAGQARLEEKTDSIGRNVDMLVKYHLNGGRPQDGNR